MSAPEAPPIDSAPICTGMRPVAMLTIARPASTAAMTTRTTNANESPLRHARSAVPMAEIVRAATDCAVPSSAGCRGGASGPAGCPGGVVKAAAARGAAASRLRGTSIVAFTPSGVFASSVSLAASP